MARPKLGRAVAAITGASVAVLLAALPAAADPPKATVVGAEEEGLKATIHFTVRDEATGEDEEVVESFPTGRTELQLTDSGAKFLTYSLVPGVELKPGAELVEPPPSDDETSKKALAKLDPSAEHPNEINWVLRHSFPFVTLDALKSGQSLDVSQEEAVAATQAAIWHWAFGAELDDKAPTTGTETNNAHVKALYAYLTGDKNTGAVNDEDPTLEVTLPNLTGKAGERVGPVKVSTTAKELTLSVTGGVKITDKDGKELAAKDIKDGSELFVQVPADTPTGQGSFELKAARDISRAFVFGEPPADRQSAVKIAQEPEPEPEFQVLVFAQTVTKSAGVAVSWQAEQTTTTTPETPAPQASNGARLADTGVSIFVPLGTGVLLLAAGAGALLFLRRRT